MKKIFLIHNTVYLPLMTIGSNRSSTTKYVGSAVHGYVVLDEIYTEQELRDKYKDDPNFKEVDNLLDLRKEYDKH